LHGFAADHHANWVTPGIVNALTGAERQVIATDARGHGRSGKPHDPASYDGDSMVLDAQAVLDHLGVTEVDVVGYSMGAMVAARLVSVDPRARSVVLGGVASNVCVEATAREAADNDYYVVFLEDGLGLVQAEPARRRPLHHPDLYRRGRVLRAGDRSLGKGWIPRTWLTGWSISLGGIPRSRLATRPSSSRTTASWCATRRTSSGRR